MGARVVNAHYSDVSMRLTDFLNPFLRRLASGCGESFDNFFFTVESPFSFFNMIYLLLSHFFHAYFFMIVVFFYYSL